MFNACHLGLTIIMMIIDVPSTPCYNAPGLCPTTPANLWLHGTALACSQGVSKFPTSGWGFKGGKSGYLFKNTGELG